MHINRIGFYIILLGSHIIIIIFSQNAFVSRVKRYRVYIPSADRCINIEDRLPCRITLRFRFYFWIYYLYRLNYILICIDIVEKQLLI